MNTAEKYSKKYLNNEINEIERSERNSEILSLTIYEKAIIFKYSNDGFEYLNESLRKTNGENDSEFGKLLNSALAKLDNYSRLVFRGANLTKSEINKYITANKDDKILIEPTFISATKSRLIAMEYGGNTLFRIFSQTGKEIEKIAKFGVHNFQNEREVLFKPNSRFNVLQITNESSYTLITMEEI